jgi:hypothetical protein
MALLGKSKSEQYLGFIPYFTHLEMYIDNILIQLKDTYSQLIILLITLGGLINSYLTWVIARYKKQALDTIFLSPVVENNKLRKASSVKSLKVRQSRSKN